MVKRLDSPWAVNDRSGAWLKVKAEYVHKDDFDCLIVGASWGSGAGRSNKLASYVVAIAVAPPHPAQQPDRFLTFAR